VRGELAGESESQICWFGEVEPHGNLAGHAETNDVDERTVARTKETARRRWCRDEDEEVTILDRRWSAGVCKT